MRTFVDDIAAHAALDPDRVAVTTPAGEVTYAELTARIDALAAVLRPAAPGRRRCARWPWNAAWTPWWHRLPWCAAARRSWAWTRSSRPPGWRRWPAAAARSCW